MNAPGNEDVKEVRSCLLRYARLRLRDQPKAQELAPFCSRRTGWMRFCSVRSDPMARAPWAHSAITWRSKVSPPRKSAWCANIPKSCSLHARCGSLSCSAGRSESGPALQDFPPDAPAAADASDTEGLACPVNLSGPQPDPGAEMEVAQSLLDELAQLLPWHDLATRRLGRSTVGISGISIEDAARYVAAHLGEPTPASYDSGMSAAEALKRACDDLKAFYDEAAAAQPGNPGAHEIQAWFWKQTAAGRIFLDLRDVCRKRADLGMQALGRSLLVPRGIDTPSHAPSLPLKA